MFRSWTLVFVVVGCMTVEISQFITKVDAIGNCDQGGRKCERIQLNRSKRQSDISTTPNTPIDVTSSTDASVTLSTIGPIEVDTLTPPSNEAFYENWPAWVYVVIVAVGFIVIAATLSLFILSEVRRRRRAAEAAKSRQPIPTGRSQLVSRGDIPVSVRSSLSSGSKRAH